MRDRVELVQKEKRVLIEWVSFFAVKGNTLQNAV
jgi:hypothetical protein